jgi:hypothetical protein
MKNLSAFLSVSMKKMKSLLKALVSLRQYSPTSNKNNFVKTTIILTFLLLTSYIISSYYNILTLVSLFIFSDLDISLNTLINLISLDNSIYVLSAALIIPVELDTKILDFRTTNETMDRYYITDLNKRPLIIERVFTLLTSIDYYFSEICTPTEFELENRVELAPEEQLSKLVDGLFNAKFGSLKLLV